MADGLPDTNTSFPESQSKIPTSRQLGIAGAIGGFVSYYYLAADFLQDLSQGGGIAGPENYIAAYLCFGLSPIVGFFGGWFVGEIAKAVKLKPTSVVKYSLFFISLTVGAIIGRLWWRAF